MLCDQHGTGLFLGERDCSLQRRHQKLLEEGPAAHLTPDQRADLGRLAVHGALPVGYTGAGTVEFLVGPDGQPYFMEMNARIQVEHPVTEMITGVDLVREQLLVAGGALSGWPRTTSAARGPPSSAGSTPRTRPGDSRRRLVGSRCTSRPRGPGPGGTPATGRATR